MAFVSAESIIQILRKRLGLNEDIYAVMQIWERELGPIAAYAKIAGIKNGFIFVDVASSVHLHELTLRKRTLINKINQHFGKEKVVKGIKLQIGDGTVNNQTKQEP
jgi:predicted nucleic acid-binding Zn ribbon protein